MSVEAADRLQVGRFLAEQLRQRALQEQAQVAGGAHSPRAAQAPEQQQQGTKRRHLHHEDQQDGYGSDHSAETVDVRLVNGEKERPRSAVKRQRTAAMVSKNSQCEQTQLLQLVLKQQEELMRRMEQSQQLNELLSRELSAAKQSQQQTQKHVTFGETSSGSATPPGSLSRPCSRLQSGSSTPALGDASHSTPELGASRLQSHLLSSVVSNDLQQLLAAHVQTQKQQQQQQPVFASPHTSVPAQQQGPDLLSFLRSSAYAAQQQRQQHLHQQQQQQRVSQPLPPLPPRHQYFADEQRLLHPPTPPPRSYSNGRPISGALPGTEKTGRWSEAEHARFLDGIARHGTKHWTDIANVVKTRTVVQVRTHAQKYFKKLKAEQQSPATGGSSPSAAASDSE